MVVGSLRLVEYSKSCTRSIATFKGINSEEVDSDLSIEFIGEKGETLRVV